MSRASWRMDVLPACCVSSSRSTSAWRSCDTCPRVSVFESSATSSRASLASCMAPSVRLRSRCRHCIAQSFTPVISVPIAARLASVISISCWIAVAVSTALFVCFCRCPLNTPMCSPKSAFSFSSPSMRRSTSSSRGTAASTLRSCSECSAACASSLRQCCCSATTFDTTRDWNASPPPSSSSSPLSALLCLCAAAVAAAAAAAAAAVAESAFAARPLSCSSQCLRVALTSSRTNSFSDVMSVCRSAIAVVTCDTMRFTSLCVSCAAASNRSSISARSPRSAACTCSSTARRSAAASGAAAAPPAAGPAAPAPGRSACSRSISSMSFLMTSSCLRLRACSCAKASPLSSKLCSVTCRVSCARRCPASVRVSHSPTRPTSESMTPWQPRSRASISRTRSHCPSTRSAKAASSARVASRDGPGPPALRHLSRYPDDIAFSSMKYRYCS
eukprot:Rhum_TRINITY_DN14382_c7_g2::Rhum_TRINITY_DN14382_c7_g2_i1::g.85322::m.85322